ncbi:MAG: RDD family protein [Micromonosporaceae bacterium]
MASYGPGYSSRVEAAPPGVPRLRRLLAWGADFGVLVLVATLLGGVTYQRITGLISGSVALAGSDVWDLLFSGGDIGGVAAEAGTALWRSAVNKVIQGFAALVVVAFLYQTVALAWTGRTVGKLLTDLRVSAPGRERGIGTGRAMRRAAITAVADVGVFAVACILLLRGWWLAAVLCWVAAVVVFWVQVLPILGASRRTLADRVAGTEVVTGGVYQAVLDHAGRSGEYASQGLAYGRELASEGRERLAEGGQRLAEAARAAAAHEQVKRAQEQAQRALESPRGKELREKGEQVTAKGRDLLRRLRDRP